jgi:hypothetical protein
MSSGALTRSDLLSSPSTKLWSAPIGSLMLTSTGTTYVLGSLAIASTPPVPLSAALLATQHFNNA